ncbi:asparagine synthase (glutamine-hydrolyzing) [Natranaerobius trueperi]|nr:asparagine synthase (glutamine-hydrolyzing) [Natranaerobius trueperi]
MSGFAGILGEIPSEIRKNKVMKMLNVLEYRGENKEMITSFKNITMGINPFNNKLKSFEQNLRPYVNERKNLLLVGDVSIFNIQELRKYLNDRGHDLMTWDDEEIILHLFEEGGVDSLEMINGYYSFVIYDSNSDYIIGARDPFGVKPFYYHFNENDMIFSSELKGLLASGLVKKNVNINTLNLFLVLQYPPEPESMVENVYRLPGGHCIVYDGKVSKVSQFKNFEFGLKSNKLIKEEIPEKTRELFIKSIEDQLKTSNRPGAFLSSGIDSASVVANIKNLYEPDIPTFSAGFHSPRFDELEFIKKFVSDLGILNYQLIISTNTIKQNHDKFFWYLDEPVADPSAFGLYMVASLAKDHVDTVFSGEGADEFFGGYNIYQEPLALNKVKRVPRPFLNNTMKVLNLFPKHIKGKNFLKRALTPLSKRYYGNAYIFSPEEKDKLLVSNYRKSDALNNKFTPIYDEISSYDEVSAMQYIDMKTWMAGDIMVKADRMLSANSLKLCAPFLNQDLCEWAVNLPRQWRVSNKETKIALRKAMNTTLPKESSSRKKLGFPVPTDYWFDGEFLKWTKEILLSKESEQFFKITEIERLISEHESKTKLNGRKLWTILTFILWNHFVLKR